MFFYLILVSIQWLTFGNVTGENKLEYDLNRTYI